MKLEAKFEEHGIEVKVLITCVDKEDYPTAQIFSRTKYSLIGVDRINFNQGSHFQHYWSHIFPNGNEALDYTKKLIEEVKENLKKYREKVIPEDIKVEI